MLARDLDNNGTCDLLTADGAGTISVLLGNGDGTFATPTSYPAAVEPVSLHVNDMNGDLFLDVIYTHLPSLNETTHFFSILWGSGPALFDSLSHVVHWFTNLDATTGDPDSDGIADVITANFRDGSVSIFHNNGGGGLSLVNTLPASIAPNAVQMHDFIWTALSTWC